MQKAATTAFPPCLTQAPLPRSLAEYTALADLTDIGAAFEPLALAGTLFDDALITTQNAGALISCRGGYGALQRSDMPLRLTRSERRADIRFACSQSVNMTKVRQDDSISLIALDRDCLVQHRVQLGTISDISVAHNLEGHPHAAPSATPPDASNVIPFGAIRRARHDWQASDVGQHLNDFLINRGRLRFQTLPYAGRNKAWEVGWRVLPSFVTFLSDKAFSTARMVVGDGLIHMDVGALTDAETYGDVVMAGFGTRRFALDFRRVRHAWVTYVKGCAQLELYDDRGAALAIIGADPYANIGEFADMLLALPPLRR